MNRIPTTFAYPVVYPSGIIVYCETEEEQRSLQEWIDYVTKENEDD